MSPAGGRYDWILFDADGTLFDYDRTEAAALAATWDESGLAGAAGITAGYRRINAELWQAYEAGEVEQAELQVERFRRLAAELGDAAADPERLSRLYLRHLGRQTVLLDGARELLAALAADYRLALITNGIPDVQRPRIRRSGLEPLFPVVVISGEVGVAKPAPEIFALALERMGGPPRSTVLMVGDSLSSDILGGIGFGLDTCWYNPAGLPLDGAPAPTYEISRLSELATVLGPARPTRPPPRDRS